MALSINGAFHRKVFLHEKRLPSTHLYALNYISKSRPRQLICITTDEQTEGIGQHGRKWHAPSGQNLNMSVILSPENLTSEHLMFINILTAISVHEAISFFTDESLKIKWPNDILFKDKKLAGILINSQLKGNKIQHLILSIGVNISTEIDSADFSYTNLDCIKNRKTTIEKVRDKILFELESYCNLLEQGKQEEIYQQYHTVLYKKGITQQFETTKGRVFDGVIKDVNKNGELNVSVDGKLESFKNGEIKYI